MVTPGDPGGTDDAQDAVIPEDLPTTGWAPGGLVILGGIVLVFGVAALSSDLGRRNRQKKGDMR